MIKDDINNILPPILYIGHILEGILDPIYKSPTNQHFIIKEEKYWDWKLLLVHIHWWE